MITDIFQIAGKAVYDQKKQIYIQVIKEIMSHMLQVHEEYGGDSPFEYKLDIVDSVFG